MKHKLVLLLIALLTIGVGGMNRNARRKATVIRIKLEDQMTIETCKAAFEVNVKNKLTHAEPGMHSSAKAFFNFFEEQIIPTEKKYESITREAIIQCHYDANNFGDNIEMLKADMDKVKTVFRIAQAIVPLSFIKPGDPGGTNKPVVLNGIKWFKERFADVITADHLMDLCCATIERSPHEKCAVSTTMGADGFSFKSKEDIPNNRVICHTKYPPPTPACA